MSILPLIWPIDVIFVAKPKVSWSYRKTEHSIKINYNVGVLENEIYYTNIKLVSNTCIIKRYVFIEKSISATKQSSYNKKMSYIYSHNKNKRTASNTVSASTTVFLKLGSATKTSKTLTRGRTKHFSNIFLL